MTIEIVQEDSFFDLLKDLIFNICCYCEYKFLIKLFVRKNSKNIKKYMECACELEKTSIVEILLKKTKINFDDAFNSLMFRRNVKIAKLLIPRLTDREKSLSIAKNFKIKEIEILLESGLRKNLIHFRKINNLKEGF
jgi:hypothetical protein